MMKLSGLAITLGLTICMSAATSACAAHDDQGRAAGGVHEEHPGDQANDHKTENVKVADAKPFFTPQRARLFRSCYFGTLPAGLEKKILENGVTPEIEKQLVPRSHLPAGVKEKLLPTPKLFDSCFGDIPLGTEIYTVGHDALLIDQGNETIVDVIKDFH